MPPSLQVHKSIPWVILVLAFVGFADAAYLSAKHFQGEAPTCVLFSGCDIVTTSEYSVIGPIPVAVLGALFYFVVLALSLWLIDKRNVRALKGLVAVSALGFLFSLYLLYLQGVVLDAWCIYCMASIISSTAIFILSLVGWRMQEKGSLPATN